MSLSRIGNTCGFSVEPTKEFKAHWRFQKNRSLFWARPIVRTKGHLERHTAKAHVGKIRHPSRVELITELDDHGWRFCVVQESLKSTVDSLKLH